MKHTPVPWILMDTPEPSRADHGWRAICVIGKRMVGVRKEQIWRGRKSRTALESGEERDANARLISKAPQLLTILKEALQQTGCDGDLCAHQWHEDARKLIDELAGE